MSSLPKLTLKRMMREIMALKLATTIAEQFQDGKGKSGEFGSLPFDLQRLLSSLNNVSLTAWHGNELPV